MYKLSLLLLVSIFLSSTLLLSAETTDSIELSTLDMEEKNPGGASSFFPELPIFTDDVEEEECEEKPGYKVTMVVVDDETRCEYVKDTVEDEDDTCADTKLRIQNFQNFMNIIKMASTI